MPSCTESDCPLARRGEESEEEKREAREAREEKELEEEQAKARAEMGKVAAMIGKGDASK